MTTVRPSYCRICLNGCPILVEVEDGRAVRVTGDASNDVYQGYTCVKGRALPEHHRHPDRLLHSQQRMPDGTYRPISSEQLMDEVADRLGDLLDRHGPQVVASYFGTAAANVSTVATPMLTAFMRAIGSTMKFNPETIDQGGKQVARALHGAWQAPSQGFDDPDVALVIGANPLVSYAGGLPMGHPGKWLQQWSARGFQLIVVDPRRSDFAKRAAIHLQPRPGHDVAILAGMIDVILAEGLYDREFVAQHVDGVDSLREVVARFTPAFVAERADVDPDDLVRAARLFAAGPRGFAVAGTGPNMSGPGALVEYLVLNLNTLCGRWLRAGDRVRTPPTTIAPIPMKAQALAPFDAIGVHEPLPGTDLRGSIAGLPIARLLDAMLHDGDDRIRALLSFGGNPAVAWPDQLKVVEALRSLELLVQVDVTMSPTAQLADFVVASKMSLETPGFTLIQDACTYFAAGYLGHGEPWAQYTAATVDPPAGSDLLEEWEFLYGVAARLGVVIEFASLIPLSPPVPLDMAVKPTTDDLLDIAAVDARVPLDEIRRHPHGGLFPDPPLVVPPMDPGCTDRLDVANPVMMRDLEAVADAPVEHAAVTSDGASLPFRLVSRRMQHVINSSGRSLQQVRGRRYNPAFVHPDDLADLGLHAGDLVEIRSARAAITAVVEPDATLRRGLVSMSHAFGALPEHDGDVRRAGANTSVLLSVDDGLQPYTGQPFMSNVAVSVTPAARVATG